MPNVIKGNDDKRGVRFIRKELEDVLDTYELIETCLGGEKSVKDAGEKYLPDPSAPGDPNGPARYKTYLHRAVFFNATKNTVNGLTGQIFAKPPTVIVPDGPLKYVLESPSGDNCSLIQQAKIAVTYCLAYSRGGVLVDFPATEGAVSKMEIDEGVIRPTITLYKPKNITNWQITNVGAKEILTLVVLYELDEVRRSDDEFVVWYVPTYRVLKLTNNGVIQEIWTLDEKGVDYFNKNNQEGFGWGKFVKTATFPMLDNSGAPLTEIPFKFFGLANNNAEVETPAIADLASVNIHHYHNSADYEENCFISGQMTVAVVGLTESWLDKVLNKKIVLGSRGGIPLPEGGGIQTIQANESSILKEAMEHKQQMMRTLGLKFIEESNQNKTATEAKIESSTERSMLQSAAENVSEVYLWALRHSADLMGIQYTDETLQFKLNDDFEISRMDASERQAVVSAWQMGALSFTEMRNVMRSAGLATQEDSDALVEIENAKDKDMERRAKLKGPIDK